MRFWALKLATASACADGDHPLGLLEDARPRLARLQMGGLRQSLEQQTALDVGIRSVAGRAERLDAFAVGFDHGDVNPVQRGAAHQTDGRYIIDAHSALPRRSALRDVSLCQAAHLIMPQRRHGRQPIPQGSASFA